MKPVSRKAWRFIVGMVMPVLSLLLFPFLAHADLPVVTLVATGAPSP